ncbi:MAG: HDOD domain-containing protein [candidate division Zixibacteria bacterium]|nr:HDOD domain-containing protein [candidate division Zixibacteria bacterium]
MRKYRRWRRASRNIALKMKGKSREKMSVISKKKLDVTKISELPSPPGIVQNLYNLISDEDASSQEVARVVEKDQAFTARVLRLVNSPFYGFSRRIVSVEEAITMLGMNAIHQLLLATSLFNEFRNGSDSLKMGEFWQHSFGVGAIAKQLLAKKGRDLRNEAFMCGILHDIGRLVFIRLNADGFQDFYRERKAATDLEREEEYFGINHQEAGGFLAQRWYFPPSISSSIRYHHNPSLAGKHSLLVSAVHVADIICHAMDIGDSGCYYVSYFDPESWKKLEIDYSEIGSVLEKSGREIEESEQMMQQLTVNKAG